MKANETARESERGRESTALAQLEIERNAFDTYRYFAAVFQSIGKVNYN